MVPALAALLLTLTAPAPAGEARAGAAPAGGAAREAVRLAGQPDVKRLCDALSPGERFRAAGDAVVRGEAERAHDLDRAHALAGQYEVVVPAAKLELAYDASEGTLSLAESSPQLSVAEGAARLWPALDPGLSVEADPATARRIVEAQRNGKLVLGLVFALPDDAACGTGARGTRFTLPVEPVAWRWIAGEAVIAAGGAAAERPLATAAQGATARVLVGAPISGDPGARRRVADRSGALETCYGEALRRSPSLDGVLVARVGDGRAAIAADSVDDAELAACVVRALGPTGGPTAAVPIRFELVARTAPPDASKPNRE
jgi:hypothetical protein